MRLSLFTTLLASTASALPSLLPRAGFTAITGPSGGIVSRYPIETLQSKYPDVFNIFILALESLQAVPETDKLSWYGIASIHGRPYDGWEYDDPGSKYGFCVHGSITFGTWHRPYMSLLEQTIVKHARQVAGTFTNAKEKAIYKAAAEKVRLPYWDSSDAKSGKSIPKIIMKPTITVKKPAGTKKIPNPLARYTFQRKYAAKRKADFAPTSRIFLDDHTSRKPSSWFESSLPSRRQNTYNLIKISTFSRFSSNAYTSEGTPYASLEDVHSAIHGAVGRWMSSLDFSSYDPIFWLHHVNVDRLMALYQAQRPYALKGSKMAVAVQSTNPAPRTFMFGPARRYDGIDTKLYPFRKKSGKEFTSRDLVSAKSCYEYGYAYPEMPAEFAKRSDDALRVHVTPIYDALYYDKEVAPAAIKLFDTVDSVKVKSVKVHEWTTSLEYNKDELKSGFSVLVYFKGQEDTPIGLATALSGAKKGTEVQSGSTVPLNAALAGVVDDLEDIKAVKDYLAENLLWKTVAVEGGEEVEVKSLKVTVGAGVVENSQNPTVLPKVGKWKAFPEITEGKAGGD